MNNLFVDFIFPANNMGSFIGYDWCMSTRSRVIFNEQTPEVIVLDGIPLRLYSVIP